MSLPLLLCLALSQADAEALKRTIAVESEAVERAADDLDALYRLGLAHLALGQPRKAIPALESLVQQDPESVDGRLLLSRAYQLAGDGQKGKELLDQALVQFPDNPSLLAERAMLARLQQEVELAVQLYQRAVVASDGKVAGILFNFGEALQKSGRTQDAIVTYKKTLEVDPGLTVARVNLGKALAEKGLYGEAKEVLLEVTRAKETLADAEAHYNLGVIHMRESNLGPAVTEFERTLAIQPRHVQALNNLGVAFDARGNTRKALEYFKKATLADPTFAEAHFNAGMSHMRLENPREAARAFEQALKLDASSTGPYVKLGTVYLQQGKRDRAVEAFKKAIELLDAEEAKARGFLQLGRLFDRQKTTDAYRGLALAYLGQGKVTEAVDVLKQAVAKMPDDASARLALGEAYLAQNKPQEAVGELKRRLELEPTIEARLDLARAYTRQGVAQQAEPLLNQVLAEQPDNRAAALGLVDLFTAMGRFGETEKALKALLEKDPKDAQALARLGILKSRMGRPNEALEPLEAAVELNPSLSDARAELAFLYFRADPANAGKCVQVTKEILLSEPRHVLAWSYLGVCLFTKGEPRQAEEAFNKAIQLDPRFPTAHYSLGQLYESQNKLDLARKAYQEASRLGLADADAELKRLAEKK